MKQKFEWSFASFTDLAGKFPFRIRSCGRGLIRQGILPKPRTLHSLEVLWCTDGVFQVEFPEGKYTMQPGYVCYYMPGETHIFDAPPGDGGQYCFVAFEGNFTCEFLKRFNITRLPHYAGACPEELFSLLYDLIRKKDDTSMLSALAEGVKLLILSTHTVNRNESSQTKDKTERNYASLAKALADLHYTDQRMNVNGIAETLSIHRVHLSREFRKVYNIPLSTYLIRCRLACAAKLLKTTDLSIKNIAVKSGFSDPVYFTRYFRNETGFSPLRFRESDQTDYEEFQIQ